MSTNIISIWQSSCDEGVDITVAPDGCRDLIMKVVGNNKPEWFVSPLFDQSTSISLEDNTSFFGFRMRPGIEIMENELIGYIESKNIHVDEVQDCLDDFTAIDHFVDEALECLSGDIQSISQAAIELGVSSRTLQRVILKKTGRPPGYWLQLARVRKAGRNITAAINFAEVAEMSGFSDQSHMNREIRRWFKSTPSEILLSSALASQFGDAGYG
ncbi:MAG: helix-turn-helix domain-containing protein [Gammaproteobacteria bacterium]|nr:helix-turn-helix domain-containing protein [Gammaproteobacteria bacterium]